VKASYDMEVVTGKSV